MGVLCSTSAPTPVVARNGQLSGDVGGQTLLDLIGQTPLLSASGWSDAVMLPRSINVLLKAEWTNPGGSIKDRTALSIVRDAIQRGHLCGDAERALLDATSGNTGIAYAMLGATLGFRVELVVPSSASRERKELLEAYGARVIYSDPYEGSNGAIQLARDLAARSPERYTYVDQYANNANWRAHFTTTGPEIWEQTRGQITHFVAGLGTTGTMVGVGRYLNTRRSSIRLVAVQPADPFHGLDGLKHLPTAIVPDIYDAGVPDRHEAVETDQAYDHAQLLASKDGFLVGPSTGAALEAARRVGHDLADQGRSGMIVVIAPDGGGRYFSTGLWSRRSQTT